MKERYFKDWKRYGSVKCVEGQSGETRKWKDWSPGEVDALRSLAFARASVAEIARELGRPTNGVIRKAKLLGIQTARVR